MYIVFEQKFVNAHGKLFQVFVIVRSNFEQLRHLRTTLFFMYRNVLTKKFKRKNYLRCMFHRQSKFLQITSELLDTLIVPLNGIRRKLA